MVVAGRSQQSEGGQHFAQQVGQFGVATDIVFDVGLFAAIESLREFVGYVAHERFERIGF